MDAYRQISHSGKAVAQTIIAMGDVAFIMLRLAFGGSPNPPCFCAFSEALTDLANKITCKRFHPDQVHVPTVKENHLIPHDYPEPSEPFAEAIEPAVEVPVSLQSRKNAFIDNIINIFLDTGEETIRRECYTVPLAVNLMGRPHAGDNKALVPRRPFLGPKKLEAKTRPTKSLVSLGWGVNTRTMKVFLSRDKFIAWEGDVNKILKEEKTTFGNLESIIG